MLEVQASDAFIGCHFEATSAYPADTLALLMRSARDALVASPNAKLTIFGHAAPTGSADADKALSDRRARFVQAVMTNDLAELEAVVEEDGGRS